MIFVDYGYKRYRTEHGPGKWVLEGINFTITPQLNVGMVGRNGAGKSTLLSIIGGVDQPTRGVVKRHCLVSWQMGFGVGLQVSVTGRTQPQIVCTPNGQGTLIPTKHDKL